jgi:hypothetical protein
MSDSAAEQAVSSDAPPAVPADPRPGVDDVLAEIAESGRRRREAAEVAFRALVVDLAAAVPHSVAEIERMLMESEKTIDDFRAAVRLRRQRLQWAKALSRRPELRQAGEAIDREIKAQEERFARLKAEHEEVLLSLRRRRHRALSAGIQEAEMAESMLRETAPAEISQRLAALDAKHAELQREIMGHREESQRLRHLASFAEQNEVEAYRNVIGSPRTENDQAGGEENDADRLRSKANVEDVAANALRAQADSLKLSRAAIEAEALLP